MITKTINGRDYNRRDFLSVLNARKFTEMYEARKGELETSSGIELANLHREFNDMQIYLMLLDSRGKQYDCVDTAIDSIAVADYHDVLSFAIEQWPTTSETDSPLAG